MRTASSSRRTTPGNASRKKPDMRTVTSIRGRLSSSQWNRFDSRNPLVVGIPFRANAPEPENLGDIVAARSHVGGAPDCNADAFRITALIRQKLFEEAVRETLADLPGESGRESLVHRRSKNSFRWAAHWTCHAWERRSVRQVHAFLQARLEGCRSLFASFAARERCCGKDERGWPSCARRRRGSGRNPSPARSVTMDRAICSRALMASPLERGIEAAPESR